MENNTEEKQLHIWRLRVFNNSANTSKYKYYGNINIIAYTAEDAIEKLKEVDSKLELLAINHAGKLDIQ